MFSIILNMRAIGKGRPRMSKKGHVYTPKETRDAEAHIKNEIIEAKPPKFLGPVFVAIRVGLIRSVGNTDDMPTIKPDLDNAAKIVLDSMNGVVYKDDAQICSLTCEKFYDDADSISITVGEIAC